MATWRYGAWALAVAVVALGGCSTLHTTTADNETAAQRFGSYCEQMGDLKGTPDYATCVRQMSVTYQ